MRILHILDHSIPLHSGYTFRTLSILREQHALGWKTSHITSSKQYRSTGMEETINGWHFYRTSEKKNLINKVIDKIFSNRPSTSLFNTRKVTASLSALHGERKSSIDARNDEVGLCIAYADSSSYENLTNRLVQESNSRSNLNQIFISLISPNNLDSTGNLYANRQYWDQTV